MSAAKPVGPKVVLDTNVYFSAFHGRGVPYRIWQAAVRREYHLLVSAPIIREIAEVLRNDLRRPEPEIIGLLKLIAKVATVVVPKTKLRVVPEDPDDDRILECAASGDADLIVSGDRHLLRLKAYRHIGIVRPVDFLRILGLYQSPTNL